MNQTGRFAAGALGHSFLPDLCYRNKINFKSFNVKCFKTFLVTANGKSGVLRARYLTLTGNNWRVIFVYHLYIKLVF